MALFFALHLSDLGQAFALEGMPRALKMNPLRLLLDLCIELLLNKENPLLMSLLILVMKPSLHNHN